MCRVLNMSKLWIFVNIRKYVRVLNLCLYIIKEVFWIFQDCKYVRFLNMQALHKVLDMPEYGWIMPYGRVLNMPGPRWQCFKLTYSSNYVRAQNMARLLISEGYKGCWICLNKSEYALIMSQYEWKAGYWVFQNYSECVWYNIT